MTPPRHTALRTALVIVTLGACGTSEAPTAPPAPAPRALAPVPTLRACAGDLQAPLFRATSDPECVDVGGGRVAVAGEWPDAAGAAEPVAYVAPGSGPGAGTRASPFHDLAEALASSPRPATLLLARGAHALTATVHLEADVVVRGVGAAEGGTVVIVARGASAFEVAPPAGAVSLVGLRVRGDLAPGMGADWRVAGVLARGAGTVLTLRDVVVERTGDGVRVEGATLCAEGLSVRRAGRAGLYLTPGSAASVRDFLIRDGENVGVVADGSVIELRTGMVANQGRDGVALRGVRTTAGTCTVAPGTPDLACPSAPICPGFRAEHRCVESLAVPPADGRAGVAAFAGCRAVSEVSDVALVGNRVTGLRAEYVPAEPGASDFDQLLALSRPGAVARAARMVVGNTEALAALPGGDGLYVGPRARLEVDPDIRSETSDTPGSLVIGNARTGILADGVAALQAHGEVTVTGTRVRGNRGPGMYVQSRAVAERVAFGDFTANAALGLGVTTLGRVVSIQCEHFIETRLGTLRGEGAAPLTLGDGLSIADGARGDTTTIQASQFLRNAGRGLVLSAVASQFVGANVVAANGAPVNISSIMASGAVAPLGPIDATVRSDVARGALGAPAR